MRKLLLLWILCCSIFLTQAQVKENLKIPANPKIGLSLSGGGAKGFAHIGVLKVLDSLGVKVDYISGTSMGAIVGGLYASGYTAKDIEQIVLETDFYTLIQNEKTREEASFFDKSTDKYILNIPIKNKKINVLPKAISSGQKNVYMLKELFKNVAAIEDFSKLPIPFMCVATNLENGKMEIFEKGDLVKSIMASSAFPSLMDPVKIGESLYIDGAMTLNYPSKPLKDKGIDVVIGVDLSQGLAKRDQLNSLIDILNQVIDFGIQKETANQYKYTDINIKPELNGLSATSYGDKEIIVQAGETEANRYVDEFKKLPKRDLKLLRATINPIFSNVYKIDSLQLENSHIYTENYVRGKMNLRVPSMHTYGSINKMVDKLYATNNYSFITYDIVQQNQGNILKLNVTEDNTRYFLKLGLHYDEVFKTGLLLNATVKRFLFRNSTISLDGIIGDKPRYYFNYFIDNGYLPGFGIYASGMKLDLRDNKGRITDSWVWLRNEAFLQSIWKDKYAIGGGLSHDYFESDRDLLSVNNSFNPYIFVKSDTQDDRSFPTKGWFLDSEAKLLDIFNDDVNEKAIQVKANLSFNTTFAKLFTYRLRLFGGFTLGQDVSPYYQFRPGAIFEQRLGNFVRFPGLQFGEQSTDNILKASHDLQVQVRKNIFVIGSFNMLNQFDEPNSEQVLRISELSAGIAAAYKSPVGQIKVNYSKAFDNHNNGIFRVILGHWF